MRSTLTRHLVRLAIWIGTLAVPATSTLAVAQPHEIVSIVSIDRPATMVEQYGQDALPDALQALTQGFSQYRLFLIVDTPSTSNTFEVDPGDSQEAREVVFQNVAEATVQAARGVPPGRTPEYAEQVKARVRQTAGVRVRFIQTHLFRENASSVAADAGSSLLRDDAQPEVLDKSSLEPTPTAVFSGLWIVALWGLGALMLFIGAVLIYGFVAKGLRRTRQRSRRPGRSRGPLPLPKPPPPPTAAPQQGMSSRVPVGSRRPSFVIAFCLSQLIAGDSLAQDGQHLVEQCLAAENTSVVDLSGSSDARDAAIRLLPIIAVPGQPLCLVGFGDSTRVLVVSDDSEVLARALRDAPRDGYTRVADAFMWTGDHAVAIRRRGRTPRITVLSDFIDDDASGAVNAAFLPTLTPPVVDTITVERTIEAEPGPLLWIVALAGLAVAVLTWVLGRRATRPAPIVSIPVQVENGPDRTLFRGAEPICLPIPRGTMDLPDAPREVALAFSEAGTLYLGLPIPTLEDTATVVPARRSF